MTKHALNGDTLTEHSPFEISFGQWANCVEIGLGENMGFMKIWRCGELQVWGQDADPLDKPSITFTPEHADLLEQLAAELRAREKEYAEYKGRLQESEESQRQEEPLPNQPQLNLRENEERSATAGSS
jgi:restriction endonuclease S subunit